MNTLTARDVLMIHAMSAWFIFLWPFAALFTPLCIGVYSPTVEAIVLYYPVAFVICYLFSWISFRWKKISAVRVFSFLPCGWALLVVVIIGGSFCCACATRAAEESALVAKFSNPIVAAIEIYGDDDRRNVKFRAIEKAPLSFLNLKNSGGTPGLHGGLSLSDLQATPLYVAIKKDDLESAQMVWKRGGRLAADEKPKIRDTIKQISDSPELNTLFQNDPRHNLWKLAADD